jgi:hypothetical protein
VTFDFEAFRGQIAQVAWAGVDIEHFLACIALKMMVVIVPR